MNGKFNNNIEKIQKMMFCTISSMLVGELSVDYSKYD
jgi:hypothetical protein